MKYTLVTFILLLNSLFVNAQNPQYHPALSKEDSAKAYAYWDSANYSPLYSQKRQLFLDSALAIMPWRAYWWQQKSHPLFKQHKYELGLPFLDSAVKYDKEKYTDYRAYMKCIFQKNYKGAINDFNAARLLHGGSGVMDHSYDFYTGLCYLQLNQFDSADYLINRSIEAVRKKLGDEWVNSTEWFYLGIVQYEKLDYPKAIDCFDKSLKIYKNFSDAKYYKAMCLAHMHKYKPAAAIIVEADQDFKQGYTIIEDGIPYEAYPYQINQRYYLNNTLKWLQEESKTSME